MAQREEYLQMLEANWAVLTPQERALLEQRWMPAGREQSAAAQGMENGR